MQMFLLESGWKAIDLLCDVMNLYFTKQPIKFLSPVNSSRREIFLHSDIITTVSRCVAINKFMIPKHLLILITPLVTSCHIHFLSNFVSIFSIINRNFLVFLNI